MATPTIRPGYVECEPDLLERLAWLTGDTIEHDPATARMYLKTDSGWYTAQLDGAA